ncbi:fasciculation and elongation protein zeta-2 isoform X3 [Latimeria chalumnae]|uniref:fasciculation and elongation protein zeta-2 isoform X3 n=1 Tax=Latimeria chalumnae TaxID=7897 RepID=UPI0003C1B302|nr:PREDICTED: fasciculation and elongation protein zeta-2 isoform X3 [Latimeria chalumnae]|eukprot:XP_005989780.1 PREDICTED: fasciculation and elongation protein zeta-2 isoform X3 [Latimeria chalumnae]
MMAAPLAQFDEDWQDFYEFKSAPLLQSRLDRMNSNSKAATSAAAASSTTSVVVVAAAAGDGTVLLEDFSELDNSFSGEMGSFKSMEDLVNDFDEKLTVCFRNYNTATEGIAPVKPITEENIMKDDEIWNALTDNYGNVMPVDWKTSHTRALHLPTLNLTEKGGIDNLNLDLSDDEELREQLDMHSIIVSCINDEPLFTAEQVIEEIEEMMQESPDPEDDETPTQSDRLSILSQEIQTLKQSSTNSSYEERVKRLSVAELNELLEEIETAIKDYSEELIQQLALRDELEFEKEVKNSFISVLIEVQNKQKEHREMVKKKKKMKNGSPQNGKQESRHMPGTRFSMEGISNVIQNGFRQTFGNSGNEKQYLTTVIPYEKKGGPPSVEDLQILTKILHAMKEDSEKVPSLLTDYILKVLCPT